MFALHRYTGIKVDYAFQCSSTTDSSFRAWRR